MAGDWRISADERARYDTYFQQCGPIQGYLSGEQARDFFVKSHLPGDILRKIWDLADVTADGRLDVREFAIACQLIASQVQKKGPLPPTLPPSLLSDSGVTLNGIPTSNNISSQPQSPTNVNNIPIVPLTASNRSKYLQQFHSLVDVTKTNGFMTGLQAKNILQQTGLSNVLLHHIWNLADNDKDGRLTADEFVVAMHCSEIARTGQPLPSTLPAEWSATNVVPQRDRINSASKSTENSTENSSPPTEQEKKTMMQSYEEKRLKNYEEGNRELERRRQLLREQEEREQKERDERERKRELELQKQREEQERKKQIEIERQLEKQRQIEQQKEEERKKLFEQREAARKEMERKSRLEWERQRMQELSSQKIRLLDQINDLKSRGKGGELELESMDDTIQGYQTKITQTETNIHTIDESIAEIQRNIMTEKNLFEDFEQQKKNLIMQLNTLQIERETLNVSVNQLTQSKEFSSGNREADQMKYLQVQIENLQQENNQIDEDITKSTELCQDFQKQFEQLRLQFEQLQQEAKNKKSASVTTTPTNSPANFANFEPTNNDTSTDELPPQPAVAAAADTTSSSTVDVDPFQTVDPFASQSDLGTTAANNDWFQPTNAEITNPSTTVDPFASKPSEPRLYPVLSSNSEDTPDPFVPKPSEPVETIPPVTSPKVKKAAPKANPQRRSEAPKQLPSAAAEPAAPADPWGTPANVANQEGDWASFDTTTEWPQTIPSANTSSDVIQYRALYDYQGERPDELSITAGDVIIIDPSKQQDEHWLFGHIGNDKQGFFPAAYTERIETPTTNPIDTTSQLSSGSWVVALADCQGKTPDKHLSFQKGELILVREQKDATWYSGSLNGKIGWFPRNHVRPATETETKDIPTITENVPATNTDHEIYEAIYPYEGMDASDLSFDVGEHIIVLKREGDWWTGQIGDRTGTFPNNYVQKLEYIYQTAIATQSYQSTEEGHLSFDKDQIIDIVHEDHEKGLYQGQIRLPDQTVRAGWFPANCVQIQTTTPAESSQSQYIAIFPYEAQQDDELSFPADAILEILDEENTSGWFKARLGDQVGLVPSTYIQPVNAHHQSSSTPCYLSPIVIPCTPTITYSCQHPFCEDYTMSSIDDSATMTTDVSSVQQLSSQSARTSAIRELIETEQRYVKDLRIVANDFIKPLTNNRTLNDVEIEKLFTNWFNLIACNTVLLSSLQGQVHFKEHIMTLDNDDDISVRSIRSVSMSNIALAAKASSKANDVHRQPIHSPSMHELKRRSIARSRRRSPSPKNHKLKRPVSVERLDDYTVPQTSHVSITTTMTIDESTCVGGILCSYLPYMADAYCEYCNCRSQANKYVQFKTDTNKDFRASITLFQKTNGGLSLNGFLTKPIQRMTRYPLLLEKILKHTPVDHPDYQSIERALERAREINERIDKKMSEQENSLRLDWLQQHVIFGTDEYSADGYIFDELVKFNSPTKYHVQRQLILHGFLTKIPSGKELLAFLFNDFLLLTTMKHSPSNWQAQLFEAKSNLQLKLYRSPIFLTDTIAASESMNDQLTFCLETKTLKKPLNLKTELTNLRTLWVRSITNGKEECQTLEKALLAENSLFSFIKDTKQNPESIIAYLNLIVQEASITLPSIPSARHRATNPYCEVTVGALALKTPFMKRTTNPKWNAPMQFPLHNFEQTCIHFNLFDHEFFSPDENIGHMTARILDILPCSLDQFRNRSSHAFYHTIYLNNAATISLQCAVEFLSLFE